jgi:hypothetical protein
MDQANFPHKLDKFLSVSAIDLKLDGDRYRTVMGLGRENEPV